MKYLYQYYYVMFLYHKKDNDTGRIKDPAWMSTHLQITISMGLLFLALTAIILKAAGLWHIFSSMGKFGVLVFFVVLPYLLTKYLLFSHLNVSKIDGKTEQYEFEPSKRTKLMYWLWFIATGPLLIVFAVLYIKKII